MVSSLSGLNHEFSSPVMPSLQPIAPLASLNSCETASKDCKLAEAVLRVKLLWNERDPNGLQLDSFGPDLTCDLDPLSLRILREFCGEYDTAERLDVRSHFIPIPILRVSVRLPA
ncbi:hypothetical protein CRM22_006321 [Opisthorchis felineus]|uniref:Uncharacterized protein n=1 Tax=Opisthorchis felineus TaxID=147828 RepID=A0A4S2LU88_OPIFE|nr:hypothetical protein CRM22_006321 [Opisthorchis felineus]